MDGVPNPLPAVGAGHHQEARPIVPDGVDLDLPRHPLDAEVVDVRRPEKVDMLPREPFDDLGLADPADHKTILLQRLMSGDPRDLHPAASEDRGDPQRTPGGVPPTQLEDPADEVPVDLVGVAPRSARLVPQPRNSVLTMMLASVSQGPLGDPVEATDLLGSNAPFQVLLDGVQAKSNIFPNQVHHFPGAAKCPDNSDSKMSRYSTANPFGVCRPQGRLINSLMELCDVQPHEGFGYHAASPRRGRGLPQMGFALHRAEAIVSSEGATLIDCMGHQD